MSVGRSDLVAGVAAVVVLAVVALVLQLPLWIGIIAAVAVYGGVRLAIPRPKEVVAGMTRGDFRRMLREGSDRSRQIRDLAAQIPKRSVQAQVLHIADTVDNIYADFKDDPKDVMQVPDFAQSYLDPLIGVLRQYVRLAPRSGGAGADATITKIEGDLLPAVEKNFDGMYHQLMQNEVVDLDAASEGLKSLLDLGGTGA